MTTKVSEVGRVVYVLAYDILRERLWRLEMVSDGVRHVGQVLVGRWLIDGLCWKPLLAVPV